MNAHNGQLVEDHEQYRLTLFSEEATLLFSWKAVPGLGIDDMQTGVAVFAERCKLHKPVRAVIDARQLDPQSPALAWVSSQKTFSGVEEYGPWWGREIVPHYKTAEIACLAVATGNPNAPGEVDSVPPGVTFRMGYFDDLDATLAWSLGIQRGG